MEPMEMLDAKANGVSWCFVAYYVGEPVVAMPSLAGSERVAGIG